MARTIAFTMADVQYSVRKLTAEAIALPSTSEVGAI